MVKRFYRTNFNIRSSTLRVIDEEGKQIGVLPKEEALEKARQKGLDLVEIAPLANPPVVRIVDFKKFLYQEEKKDREVRKKVKGGEVKGLRLTPFIAQADLEVRIKRAESFLKDGNKVRIAVRFSRRELGKKQFGEAVLQKMVEALSQTAHAEGELKMIGREMVLTLTPSKKGHDEKETQNQEVNRPQVQSNKNG